jgi:triphosphoribosyl-dephospho-CoA synthase
MKELLPEVVEIPRLKSSDGDDAISASAVRQALAEGHYSKAAALCPETTHAYLLAALAERALRKELDLPGKPGLVCPESKGAHTDMDYGTMLRGIQAIRPYFPAMALASSADELRRLGIEAEEAMMAATGGVNTHRGAIFCMGIALNACGESTRMAALAAQICGENHSAGARSMALSGYKQLFEDWLPYYAKEDELKTLLSIMSTLDDTCVVKRAGYDRAQEVKQEAARALEAEENYFSCSSPKNQFSSAGKELCDKYAAEGISPGGAADMLALTIFIHSIIS